MHECNNRGSEFLNDKLKCKTEKTDLKTKRQ